MVPGLTKKSAEALIQFKKLQPGIDENQDEFLKEVRGKAVKKIFYRVFLTSFCGKSRSIIFFHRVLGSGENLFSPLKAMNFFHPVLCSAEIFLFSARCGEKNASH